MLASSTSGNYEPAGASSLRILHRMSSRTSEANVAQSSSKPVPKELPPLAARPAAGVELPQLFPSTQGRTGRALLRAIPRDRSTSPAARLHRHKDSEQQQQQQQQQQQPLQRQQLLGASRRGGDLAALLAADEQQPRPLLQPRRSSSNTNLYNSNSNGNNWSFLPAGSSNVGGSSSAASRSQQQHQHLRADSKVHLPSLLPPISGASNEGSASASLAGDSDLAAALQSRSRARVREQRERERKRAEDADARRREESMLKRQRAEERAPELQAERREIARRAGEVFKQHRTEAELAEQEREEVLSARREKANRYKTPQRIREHQAENPWTSPRRRVEKTSREASKSAYISAEGEGSSASSSSRAHKTSENGDRTNSGGKPGRTTDVQDKAQLPGRTAEEEHSSQVECEEHAWRNEERQQQPQLLEQQQDSSGYCDISSNDKQDVEHASLSENAGGKSEGDLAADIRIEGANLDEDVEDSGIINCNGGPSLTRKEGGVAPPELGDSEVAAGAEAGAEATDNNQACEPGQPVELAVLPEPISQA